jgi:hypothetical protein
MRLTQRREGAKKVRRLVLLALPVVALAGALWFVKESRPIRVNVSREQNTHEVVLRRFEEEFTRHRLAPVVTVARNTGWNTDSHRNQVIGYNRRVGTLQYASSINEFSGSALSTSWAFNKVDDEDIEAAFQAMKQDRVPFVSTKTFRKVLERRCSLAYARGQSLDL